MLHDPDVVADRVVQLVTSGRVHAVDGSQVSIAAETVCVHGDTPEAVAMAAAIRARLDTDQIHVKPFI